MAKKNLNEDALKTNLDAEVADELVATITPTYKQALDDHKRNKKSREDAEKERAEATAKAVEIKDNKKVNDGAKKLHLSEDFNDNIDENTFSAFVYNELFGEHNYKPFLKLPGLSYNYDIEIGGEEVDRADREKVGGGVDDFIIGIRLYGKTPEDRKEETKRMRALAKKLDLPFGITRDKKYAFVLIFDHIARRDANRVMRELDFENVPDKPFIKNDKDLDESKQLNEGPGAGYTIEGYVDDCKVKSVGTFKDDQYNNENKFYTGYIVDVDANCSLSDLYAESYGHGNGVADNGHVPAKITQVAISAGGLDMENPTNDDIIEYTREELSNLSSGFKSSLGGGWAHTTFEGEFLASINSDNTYISEAVIVIENKNVIRAIDAATTGDDWVTEYVVIDEDGDVIEFFEEDEEDAAIDFAKKNRGTEVQKREYQYTLLSDLESEDISYSNAPVTVWEREYTKSYRYDESVKESCNSHETKKGVKKPLKEKLIKKFTKVVDVDDEHVNSKSFRDAVSNVLGPEELYGGSIEKIKNFKIYHYISAFDDGVDDHIACKFDALVNGDFDETDSRGRFANRRWISFDFSMYNNMFYQAWWDKEDGEPVPNSDVGTIYYRDHSSEIIDALMEDNGENIWFIITELENALDQYVPVPEFNDEDIDESCKAKKDTNKALKEGKELKEGLDGDGIDVKFDLIERAESYIDEGHSVEDAIHMAIDDGLIYDEDRIAIAYHIGSLDASEVLDNAYEDIFNEIYEGVKDYHHDENDDDDDTHYVDPEVDESLKDGKDLEESIMIEVDDDDALDMLMDRVEFWAKGPEEEIALELYQQMYENFIAERFFDGGRFDVKEIVDNDWVNYCKIVREGDEYYDEIISAIKNGDSEFGDHRIEAQSRDDDGKEVFLIRYIG